MADKEKPIDIKAWCKRIIDGAGGLNSFNKYENGGSVPTRQETVEWTIRCLGNPKCEGSQEVLDAILKRRENVK